MKKDTKKYLVVEWYNTYKREVPQLAQRVKYPVSEIVYKDLPKYQDFSQTKTHYVYASWSGYYYISKEDMTIKFDDGTPSKSIKAHIVIE